MGTILLVAVWFVLSCLSKPYLAADMSIRVYNTTTNENSAILKDHTRGISDVAWSPDSQYLASASDDAIVNFWSPHSSADPIKTFKGHTNYVFCVEFGPTGGIIASGSFDESIRLWDVRSGKCLRTISAHADPITGVSFSPDGTILASSSYDGLIRIWDVASGRCLKTIVDDDNPPVSSVKFSLNGKYLLASTLDDTVRLWNLLTGKCVKFYAGHVNKQYCIPPCFIILDDDGDGGGGSWVNIAMGSEDGRLLIWDLNSRKIGFDEKIFDQPTMSVAIHPNRRILAAASLEPQNDIKLFSF